MTRRIYLASSWRNEQQQEMVSYLRNLGHSVYDFKNPPNRISGFHWSDMDENWQTWTKESYREKLLSSPVAASGFTADLRAMKWADTCVLLMPCGRSAHLELGWCAGAGKYTIIYLSDGEPELMYLLADKLVYNLPDLEEALR